MISHLSCNNRDCFSNSAGVCSHDAPRISLFKDGTATCESREDNTYAVLLTREEIMYLSDILNEQWRTTIFMKKKAMIGEIVGKLNKVLW